MTRAASASSVGTTKSRAAMVLPSPTSARHCGDVFGREPVEDRPVGLASGEAQHAGAQGAEEDRRPLGRPGARA